MNTTTSRFRISRVIQICSALLIITIVMAITKVSSCLTELHTAQEKYDQGRSLIEALRKQDIPRAVALVEAGASPRVPLVPGPRPALKDLFQLMTHPYMFRPVIRPEGFVYHDTNAFMLACGSWSPDPNAPHLEHAATLPLVKAMLTHYADLNNYDETGMSALMWATVMGRTDIMEELMPTWCTVQYVNGISIRYRRSAAYYADRLQNPEVIALLLQRGADPREFHPNKAAYDCLAKIPISTNETLAVFQRARARALLSPEKQAQEPGYDPYARLRPGGEEATPVEQYLSMIEKSNKIIGDSQTRISRGL